MMRFFSYLLLGFLLVSTSLFSGCLDDGGSTNSGVMVGDNALDYLRDDGFDRLMIEIDYVEGHAPSDEALDLLKVRMRHYLDKPGGISITKSSFQSSKTNYTPEDIRQLRDAHQSTEHGGGLAVVHILYLNGHYSEGDSVLGLAYGADCFVMFIDPIRDISIPFWASQVYGISSSDFESSVLVHEFGHLLGLVEIGYTSPHNYNDGTNHSTQEGCVMQATVETVSIINIITQDDPEPPNDFGSFCADDLEKRQKGEL